MAKLHYKFKRRLGKKEYTNPEEYYGAVYEDLVKHGTIKEEDIRSDADLKAFLDKQPTTSSDKLYQKLIKTAYHKEVINQNLTKEGKYRLKNKKVVDVKKKTINNVETYYYGQTLVIAGAKRTTYRDARTGRFVSIK